MAQLHLIPDPTVLAVQAGIFLVGIAVVKKLMLEPYLSVRSRREALTTGSQADAKKALAEALLVTEKITGQINEASAQARAEKEVIREKAINTRNDILGAANAEAKAIIERVVERIQGEVAEETQKIPANVSRLTDEVYGLAVQ